MSVQSMLNTQIPLLPGVSVRLRFLLEMSCNLWGGGGGSTMNTLCNALNQPEQLCNVINDMTDDQIASMLETVIAEKVLETVGLGASCPGNLSCSASTDFLANIDVTAVFINGLSSGGDIGDVVTNLASEALEQALAAVLCCILRDGIGAAVGVLPIGPAIQTIKGACAQVVGIGPGGGAPIDIFAPPSATIPLPPVSPAAAPTVTLPTGEVITQQEYLNRAAAAINAMYDHCWQNPDEPICAQTIAACEQNPGTQQCQQFLARKPSQRARWVVPLVAVTAVVGVSALVIAAR